MSSPEHTPGDDVSGAEERRHKWSELPPPVAPDDMTTSEDSAPPAPDLVTDPDHEFMIRHAG